jgi:glycosyltransferase involved in cell wall biosynthesis
MRKLKVVRVVTASYVVPWHLGNTLKRCTDDFETCVIGQNVSDYKNDYSNVLWFDIDLNRKINLIADLKCFMTLCCFFWEYKPDIVHSIMPKAGLLTALAAFICRVPIRIHTFTGQLWATKQSLLWPLWYFLDKLINTLNTICFSDSNSQSLFLFNYHIRDHGKPLPVLGHGSLSGVDLKRFNYDALQDRAEELRAELGISKNQFVFSFIARKSREKGALDMIAAFADVAALHAQCVLLFIGPDESEGELERLQRQRPELFKQVLIVGEVSNHELFIVITNVLCLPSYREGFGTIVIDAAALGVPTIGSNIVGLVDSIEDQKTGILFPVGNLEKFTEAMLSFIRNPAQLKTMGHAARERVERSFSADMLYAELKHLYLKLATRIKY